jgi:hypothetical protein
MTERTEERNALVRLGLTNDGRTLLQRLFLELQTVAPPGLEYGALSELNGRRSLARELIEGLTRDHAPSRTDAAEPELAARRDRAGESGERPARRGARWPYPSGPAEPA